MHSNMFRVTAKNAIADIMLVTNALVWYYLVIRFLENISIKIAMDSSFTTLMWALHFGGMIFFAIAGVSLVKKLGDRRRFIALWMMIGIVFSAISMMIDTTYLLNVLFLSFVLGSSFGLGMPSCMGRFTENVRIENRGRVGGVMLLLSGVGIAALGTLAPVENFWLQTLLLSTWRVFGLIIFLLFGQSTSTSRNWEAKMPSYKSFFGQRPFFLYLIPWTMFSLITYLTAPIQQSLIPKLTADSLLIVENVIIGFFAVAGGFLVDRVGRKRVAIIGFVLLGLGYSVLGIGDPSNELSWYFYTAVDGIAWAMLFVIFVITIWGDLSHEAPSDKHYALGVIPFFISKFLQYTIGSNISSSIPVSSLFSFIAFFLFLAVLPLVYAPETLPEKIMKKRELSLYVEKAKEIAQKYY